MHAIQRRKWRTVQLSAVVLVVTAAATWLWAHEGHAPLPSRGAQIDVAKGAIVLSRESREALDVQTAEVGSGAAPDFVSAYATLVAPWARHGFASAQLPGRITAMYVQAGQQVAVGQVLAELRSLELANLSLELLNAQNDARLAENVLKIVTESTGAEATIQVVNARTKRQQSANALEMAKTKWLGLGLPRDGLDALLKAGRPSQAPALPVRSPVAGTVIHADLTVGKNVESGEHLFEVIDLSKVWAKIGVLERDLQRVAVGQPVELRLTAYPGESFRSTIRVKGLAFEPQTNLNDVWAEFQNPPDGEPRFLPGMTGVARIAQSMVPGTLTIPVAALIDDGVERYVLVEAANTAAASEYQKTPVVVVRQTADAVVVRSASLLPGTRVVTQGSHELGAFFQPGVLRLSPVMAKTAGLTVEPVGLHEVQAIVELDGAVDLPPDRRTVVATALGGTITGIRVDIGQRVAAGQVVADVASLEFQNRQLELLKDHYAAELLDQQYQSQKKLGSIVSGRTLLELESDLTAAKNRRDTARRRLEIVGLRSGQIDEIVTRKRLMDAVPVRAAADGNVVRFDKVLGEAVRAGESLFEVHELSQPLIQAFVSERDLARVRLGQTARVRFAADPTAVVTGKVVRSSRVVADPGQSLSVWVELDRSPAEPLRHHQLTRVTLAVERPAPVLAVPVAAIVRDGTQGFVFVRTADGIFDRRAVETGRVDDRFVEVRGGLREGEAVAVGGAADLWTAYSSLR
jgi:RND family efflux transporter MFP subunit